MQTDIRFFVNANIPWAGADLYVQHNGAWVANMQCVQIGERDSPPVAMQLSDIQAQELMDQLWQAGYRPPSAKGGEATLAAVERHLEDMRSLAFHKLGVPKP